MKETKCVVERGTDEKEEQGRRWRGSCWGIESVSMLIALIWRGWWTEDSTSALIQAHFPRSQLLDSQLSSPKKPERLAKTLRVWCCFLLLTAFISIWRVLVSSQSGTATRTVLFSQNNLCQGYLGTECTPVRGDDVFSLKSHRFHPISFQLHLIINLT